MKSQFASGIMPQKTLQQLLAGTLVTFMAMVSVACAGSESGSATDDPATDAAVSADANVAAVDAGTAAPDIGQTDTATAPASAGLVGTTVLADGNPDPHIVEVKLTAGTTSLKVFDDTPALQMYTYNGQFPGPTLHATIGDKVIVHFNNDLPEATTVHWHGLRISDKMDGNPRIQEPVKPGGTFKYEFVVKDAGTYWYHPHMRSNEQVEKGLYGAIVVHEAKIPPVARERLLVMDDIRVNKDGTFPPFLTSHPSQMHGRLGNRLLVNGKEAPIAVKAQVTDIERWRIVNTANARTMHFDVQGEALVRVVGTDGGLLDKPYVLNKPLTVPVGQRYDLEVLYGAAGKVALRSYVPVLGANNKVVYKPFAQLEVDVADKKDAPDSYTSPFPGAKPHKQRFINRKAVATFKAVQSSISPTGLAWLINDKAYWKDKPLWTFDEGDTVEITIKNLAGPEHPFHLHGQFFEIIEPNDQPGLKDTVLVPGMKTVKIRAYMDNPGQWMAHCHILGHAAQGMMSEMVVNPKKAP